MSLCRHSGELRAKLNLNVHSTGLSLTGAILDPGYYKWIHGMGVTSDEAFNKVIITPVIVISNNTLVRYSTNSSCYVTASYDIAYVTKSQCVYDLHHLRRSDTVCHTTKNLAWKAYLLFNAVRTNRIDH